MKTFVQFLVRNQNSTVEPLKGKNDVHVIDERKPLANQISDTSKVIDKHEQKDVIVGFNIVEVHAFQNKEIVTHQIILDY